MGAEVRYRVEVTGELALRAEPEVAALLGWWSDRAVDVVRTRRRLPLAALRWVGLLLALAGVAVAGFGVVVAGEAACRRAGVTVLLLDGAIAVFVGFATVFAFMPRIVEALHAWSRGRAPRQAAAFVAKARGAAPFVADYALAEGRLVARVDRPRLVSATDLDRVEAAAFGREVACLFGVGVGRTVRRLLWLPAGDAREALRRALVAAGVAVVELAARV